MARNAEQTLEPDLGIPQEDPNITVDLDAEPEDGDDRATEGDRSDDEPRGERVRDPKTGKWAQKKRERGVDRREAQNWRQEKATYEQRLKTATDESQRQIREMQMRMDNLMRQPAPGAQSGGQAANPFAAQMTSLEAQLDTELKLIEADPKRDYKRYNELRREEQRLVIREENWRAQQGQQQRQQAPAAANPYAARQVFIESEYPWTMDPSNADLCKKAAAYKQYLVNAEGRLDTIDTDREALNWAATKHGAAYGITAAPAAPSQRTQQFYAGPGQRTAPRRQGSPREITVPKALLNGSGLSAASIADALRDE